MKLYEYQGADLFDTYGIATPKRELLETTKSNVTLPMPVVLKAQVLSGDRKKAGGVLFAETTEEAKEKTKKLFDKEFQGEKPQSVLAVEKLEPTAEYYISFSYDTDSRGPVLSVSTDGGSGIENAHVTPIDILEGLEAKNTEQAFLSAGFPKDDMQGVVEVTEKLWKLFIEEGARLAEINPLMKLADGSLVAADAKVIIDGKEEHWSAGQTVEMDGDIAIIASSGGASLLNLDALLRVGGRPANYTEYGGNPPAEVVIELTGRVLGREGIKGLWVIGPTASFTDVYETMSGFVEGLRHVQPKPTYPIVVRRDGPRRKEALEMLEKVKKEEGFDFYLYDSHTPMVDTAKTIVDLAYGK